jgi:hypothetical protein
MRNQYLLLWLMQELMVQVLEKDEGLVLGRRLLMEIMRSSGVDYLVSSTLNVQVR